MLHVEEVLRAQMLVALLVLRVEAVGLDAGSAVRRR
jgi:hypothetical protein